MVALKAAVVAAVHILLIATAKDAVVRAMLDNVVGVVVAHSAPKQTSLVGALPAERHALDLAATKRLGLEFCMHAQNSAWTGRTCLCTD